MISFRGKDPVGHSLPSNYSLSYSLLFKTFIFIALTSLFVATALDPDEGIIFPNLIIDHSQSYGNIDNPNLIDIVIPWVNGSDLKWAKRFAEAKMRTGHKMTPEFIAERYIQHNELKYELRSIEKFAPWINKIHIITDDQCPYWLNTSHPKIHLVDHSTLFYPGYHSFSTNSIHYNLFKIPNVSRYVILCDDDDIFLNYVNKNDFFDEEMRTYQNGPIENYIKTRLTFRKGCDKNGNSYFSGIRKANVLLRKRFHSPYWFVQDHVQMPMDMNLYFGMLRDPKLYKQIIPRYPFRSCSDYVMPSLYFGYSMLSNQSIHPGPSHRAYFSPQDLSQLYEQKTLPKLVCTNKVDDYYEKVFLNTIFPNKSTFEI